MTLNAGDARDAIQREEERLEELAETPVLVEVDGDVHELVGARYDAELGAIVLETGVQS
jgi:hypothetical protein